MIKFGKRKCVKCGHVDGHHKTIFFWKQNLKFLLRITKSTNVDFAECQEHCYNGKMGLWKYQEGEKCDCKKFVREGEECQ